MRKGKERQKDKLEKGGWRTKIEEQILIGSSMDQSCILLWLICVNVW